MNDSWLGNVCVGRLQGATLLQTLPALMAIRSYARTLKGHYISDILVFELNDCNYSAVMVLTANIHLKRNVMRPLQQANSFIVESIYSYRHEPSCFSCCR